MAEGKQAVPVMVYLDPRTVERIDVWAKKLGQTRSKFTRFLIEESIFESGISYDIITSRPSIAIMNVVRQMNGKPPIGWDVATEADRKLLGKGVVPAA